MVESEDLSDVSIELLAMYANAMLCSSLPKFDFKDFPKDQFSRKFINSNPELYNNPFYSYQINNKTSPYTFRMKHSLEFQPYEDSPYFTFQRFGMTETKIKSKDFTIYIGGEYDDSYDPDFLIYNDVICKYDDGTIKHYGYPESVFPCTDFHTATYYPAHNAIYIIGRIGYDTLKKGEFKATEVFALNLDTFAIWKVDVKGISAGWIYHHKAQKIGDKIKISYNASNSFEGPLNETIWFNPIIETWECEN